MSEAPEVLMSPLLEEVAAPITETNPVGIDVSYDDEFLTLKSEVDQLSSVNPESVDCERVIDRCRLILGRKSKDLRVATYLAFALARTSGFRGIQEGLLAQQLLMERYWESMYPPISRMRARQNALQFTTERLKASLENLAPGAGDGEAIEASMVALKALQAFTTEVMGDLAPVWSGLGKALEDAQRRVPKEAPAPAQPGLPEDGAVAPPAEGRLSSPSALSPASDLKNESEALEAIVGVAGFLREQTPANPISYRLDRVARWDAVVAEPSNEEGKTFLEDPAPHRLTYMNSLVDSKDWKTLLQTAEDAFTESPLHFWLDLQRFVATALDGLGEEYEGAKQTVLLETAVLLKRVRSLSQLAFRSGTPFANPKTRFWLEDTVAPVLASDSGNASAVNDERLSEQIEAAKRLGADGKLSEAIGLLQDGLQQEGTRRGRFLRRLGMANVCMQASKPTIACPILESLEAEIDTLALNEWEPNLALEVWSQLHQCYGLLLAGDSGSQEPTREKAQRVFGKICEIDASRALGS